MSVREWFQRHPRGEFVVLAGSATGSAMAYSALQESVFRVDGFVFGGWVTFITSVVSCACGGLELAAQGAHVRRGAWWEYAVLAGLIALGMYLTNYSLNYLDYSTRIVAKSSKVVPTMIIGSLLLGRRYSWAHYFAAVLLVAGVSMFLLADSSGKEVRFSPQGVVLITGALFADAATSNWEEKRFFKVPVPVDNAEVIACSSLLAAALSLLVLCVSGEAGPAVRHSRAHPAVVTHLVAASACGYASVSLVLVLIRKYGATNTEIIKTVRKVLSVCLSFALFTKAVRPAHAAGLACTVGSLSLTVRLQSAKDKGASPPAASSSSAAAAAAPLSPRDGGGGVGGGLGDVESGALVSSPAALPSNTHQQIRPRQAQPIDR